MTISPRYLSYEDRLEKKIETNINKTETCSARGVSSTTETSPAAPGSEDSGDDNMESIIEEDGGDNFEMKKYTRKSKTVLVELPRDILNNPEVVGMLDRTGTSSRNAIGVVSTILKTGKIEGKGADLSQFNLSRSSLERKRANNRSILMD